MHSNNQALQSGLRIRVRSEKKPIELDIVGCYCPNPDCPCRNATLYFFKADGKYNTKLFTIVVDYETWRLVSTDIHRNDDDYALIIHEFMEALDDEMKSLIRAGKETASSDRHSLRGDIDYSVFSDDGLVCYAEIYKVNPYEQWLLELDGMQYIAVDYYCPNPKCDCRDVTLAFDRVDIIRTIGPPALKCKINFDTERRVIEERGVGISTQLAESMIEELMTLFAGGGLELFKERYARIKDWGRVHLQPELRRRNAPIAAAAPKVGRNSPCPCGSGQKYKRCCGRQ